ncbi:MAG: NAD(P)/FAD-dependent oxidoreductase [Omnitrophica WOR_2 bacterium]
MSDQVDVLIIGGGPAGLAAGIAFAGQGVRTLVCEQKTFPVDKACGEGLMPTGLARLQRLGVTQHIPPGKSFPLTGIRYVSSKGQVLSGAFAEGPGLGMRRVVLSSALAKRAGEMDLLKVRQGCQAVPTGRTQAGIRVRVNGDEMITRLLVGADGLNSRVRTWAGLQGPKPGVLRWGARQHFQVAPWSEYVEVYWQKGVEAYVTPSAAGLVGVAFLWDRDLYRPAYGGGDLIPSLLCDFPVLEQRLDRALPLDAPLAVGPMQRRVRTPVADGILLVGDAAGYLDAITGEGLSLALAQALVAAEIAVPLLKSDPAGVTPLSARALQPYVRAHKAMLRTYLLITRLVLYLSRRPGLMDRFISILSTRPAVFQALLSANMGYLPGPFHKSP